MQQQQQQQQLQTSEETSCSMSQRMLNKLVYGNNTFPSKLIPYIIDKRHFPKKRKILFFFKKQSSFLFFPNSVNRSLICSYINITLIIPYNNNNEKNYQTQFFCFLSIPIYFHFCFFLQVTYIFYQNPIAVCFYLKEKEKKYE